MTMDRSEGMAKNRLYHCSSLTCQCVTKETNCLDYKVLSARGRCIVLCDLMRLTASFTCLSSLILATLASATTPTSPQHVNFWKLEARARALEASRSVKTSPLALQDSTTGFTFQPPGPQQHSDYSEFPEQFFEQPIDHTDLSQGTFKQRYWISTRHYVPGSGGPVIVLDGGETSGEDRLPFLDTGIVEILTNATGGVGVVLEHRYYGMYNTIHAC